MTAPLSASQVNLVRECPRRYWFRYASAKDLRVEEPTPPGSGKAKALAAGIAIHAVVEKWLAQSEDLDLTSEYGLRARPALAFLPHREACQSELEVDVSAFGVRLKQYMDLWAPDAHDVPHLGALETAIPPGTPAVLDLKTTKNPKRKYRGKKPGLSTPEDFLSDPQALTYALAAFKLVPAATHVFLRWVYVATAGAPYAEPRDALVSKLEVAEGLRDHVLPWVGVIPTIRRKTSHLQLPARASMCEKYKSNSPDPAKRAAAPGCGYMSLCTDVTARDRAFAALDGFED